MSEWQELSLSPEYIPFYRLILMIYAKLFKLRPITVDPGLNFNPGSYILLFKSRFGIIFFLFLEHSILKL